MSKSFEIAGWGGMKVKQLSSITNSKVAFEADFTSFMQATSS